MLFSYKYVPHQMEKMQEFIDFIFFEVWCKAPEKEYGIHLFEAEGKPWKSIMEKLFQLDLAGKLNAGGAAAFFYNDVNLIFNEFKNLTANEIEYYKNVYKVNNNIEDACQNQCPQQPTKYTGLMSSKLNLNELLKDFFSNLYSSGFFNLKLVKDAFKSTLSEYYMDFVRENNEDICPFCGLQSLDGEFAPTREAFDHYLPKSLYPFNSVNLRNLAPSCNKCNSGNKRDKDTVYKSTGIRRKAFYPFMNSATDIELKMDILDKQWDKLTPNCFNLQISSSNFQEEVDTWIDLFRIDQRYAARCCGKRGDVNWLNTILIESRNYHKSSKEALEAVLDNISSDPLSDANFLKKAFLEACDRAGLFTE